MPYRASESHSRSPAAFLKECLRIRQLQNFPERLLLVGRTLVIRFDDAIADPVADIATLLHRAVVEPERQVGLIDVGAERSLQLLFATLRQRGEVLVPDLAGCELGHEFGGS